VADGLLYALPATAVIVAWIVGLSALGVFTADDVKAWRRLASLRGFALPRSRIEKAALRAPILQRVEKELDLSRLLAIADRRGTPAGFLGQSMALALFVLALLLAVDAAARSIVGDWPLSPWVILLLGLGLLPLSVVELRQAAHRNQEIANRTLGDMMMSVAVMTDSRGLQVEDAVRVMSRCARSSSLENLIDKRGFKRLVPEAYTSSVDLFRLVGERYGIASLVALADATAITQVGVPERAAFSRFALSVYQGRLAEARVKSARAKILVTLPVAGMLIPLLLLIGAPTFAAITGGLQGG
jgi:hypothetical protein